MSQTIYVTGHKHPDTDSVASAIAYAYLKNQQGVDCVACRLGELNDETKYLLDRFGFVAPYYLKDARVSLSDIALDDPLCVHPDTTIYETLQLMENENKPSIAVTDDTGKVLGHKKTSSGFIGRLIPNKIYLSVFAFTSLIPMPCCFAN